MVLNRVVNRNLGANASFPTYPLSKGKIIIAKSPKCCQWAFQIVHRRTWKTVESRIHALKHLTYPSVLSLKIERITQHWKWTLSWWGKFSRVTFYFSVHVKHQDVPKKQQVIKTFKHDEFHEGGWSSQGLGGISYHWGCTRWWQTEKRFQ